MNRIEVTFPSADPSCQLSGDLTLPPTSDGTDKLPAVIIIAGSGPIDRNGNVPSLHAYFNTSNNFAEHITSSSHKGIAILSYDKRGVGKSQHTHDKNCYYKAGMWDFVYDAVEAVKFVSDHSQIDKSKIILLGHSEGAIILPLICNEVTKSNANLKPIHGCIFYAGFGENLIDAMAFQRTTLLKEVNEKSGLLGWILRKVITKERLEKQYTDLMTKVNADNEPEYISMYCGLMKQPAKWLREHAKYNTHIALKEYISCHCLAITGMKDFQVRNEFCIQSTAEKLVPHAKSIEVHRPINLTHILRSTEEEAKVLNAKSLYGKMSKMPLDEELLAITDAWLDRVLFAS